jgi:hypothetical protein
MAKWVERREKRRGKRKIISAESSGVGDTTQPENPSSSQGTLDAEKLGWRKMQENDKCVGRENDEI